MAARLMIVPGCTPSRDANGRALPAKLRFYVPASGGTLKPVYTDDTLTTTHSQPVSSDADGYFAEFWADDAESFDVGLTRQDTDAFIRTFEGVEPVSGDVGDAATAAASSAAAAAQSAADAAAGVTAATNGIPKSANFAAVAGARYLLDSSGGIFTGTLPASPAEGDAIIFEDNVGGCSTHNVTIARNGKTIDGAASNYLIDLDYAAMRFTYSGTTWIPRRYF